VRRNVAADLWPRELVSIPPYLETKKVLFKNQSGYRQKGGKVIRPDQEGAPGRLHGAVLLLATLMALTFAVPAASYAGEVPHITSFTASPSSAKVGSSTVISAAISPLNSSYHVAIVNTDTGKLINRCAGWFSPCSSNLTIPWSQNRSPKDLHLEAEVVPESARPTGSGTPLTVHVERFEWNISLSASKNPLTVGEKTTLRVEHLEPDPRYTGYQTQIVNDETGKVITSCAGSECWQEVEFPDSMQANAGPVPIHAEVVSTTAPYDVAGRADLTLYVDPIPFRVSMIFSEPQTAPGGGKSWLASATPSPQRYSSSFTTWIYRSDGSSVTGCVLWITCASRVGPGTYRAVVKDSENIYAASQWWTIAPGNSTEPEEEVADDFNLLALAAMFATPSEVCSALLFYPGTHLQGSSLSDQYLACEEAVAVGKTTPSVLRAVAAAGGGTAVLWYLYEQKTKEQTSPEATEPAEETQPPPAPPIGWPGEIATEAEVLRQLNPDLKTEREARIVAKQCRRLAIRAALPVSDCIEMPIFASGDLDVPQATKHDLEALLYYSGWVKLNYEDPETKTNRAWYNAFSVCDEEPRVRNCDEFPFFSTAQGGGNARPRPSLKLINATQNKRQGGKLSGFYKVCGVNVGVGKPFLNIPMPPGSNVSTLILCNGNS
jgi:hypothetical protein